MIPYVSYTSIPLGPLTIQVWGLLVALGIVTGTWLSSRELKKRGLPTTHLYDLAFWVVVAAMLMARVFHVVFYEPTYYLAYPAEMIAIWHGGLSFIGGLVGAAIAVFVYANRKKLSFAYIDACIYGLPLGMFIGRIGCFLIHDHPGTLTHFLIGVEYPNGMIRHDLGLYESLTGLALFALFLVLNRKPRLPGFWVATFCAGYGMARFFLDFLRLSAAEGGDARYFGLTPAQYGALVMVGVGVFLLNKQKHQTLS